MSGYESCPSDPGFAPDESIVGTTHVQPHMVLLPATQSLHLADTKHITTFISPPGTWGLIHGVEPPKGDSTVVSLDSAFPVCTCTCTDSTVVSLDSTFPVSTCTCACMHVQWYASLISRSMSV